VSGDGPLTHH